MMGLLWLPLPPPLWGPVPPALVGGVTLSRALARVLLPLLKSTCTCRQKYITL